MPLLRKLRSRLHAERGFTLIELMVAISISSIVMLGGFTLAEISQTATLDVQARAGATQTGRSTTDTVSQSLSSAVCVPTVDTPIISAKKRSVTFYAAPRSNPTALPDWRQVVYSGGEIKELNRPAVPGSQPGTYFSAEPTTRVLTKDAAEIPSPNGTKPVFDYYDAQSTGSYTTLTSLSTGSDPLPPGQVKKIDAIGLSFTSRLSDASEHTAATTERLIYVDADETTDTGMESPCK